MNEINTLRLQFIKKVIYSCRTPDQLLNTQTWAKYRYVLNKKYNAFSNHFAELMFTNEVDKVCYEYRRYKNWDLSPCVD